MGHVKNSPSLPFKPLHENTVRLVHGVRAQYTSQEFTKEPIVEACQKVMNALGSFYNSCEKSPTSEDVMENVQKYLFKMKQALDPNASREFVTNACKDFTLHVVQVNLSYLISL